MKILAIGDPHGDLEKIKKISLEGLDLIVLTGDIGKSDIVRKMTFENIDRQKAGLAPKEYSKKRVKAAFDETEKSILSLVKYLSGYALVYLVYGNIEATPHMHGDKHSFAKTVELDKKLSRYKNVKVINNKLVTFKGVRIGGLEYFVDTNWVEDFKPANYEQRIVAAKKATAKATTILNRFGKVDLLICHQPPFGYLDQVNFIGAPLHWQGKNAGSKATLSYIKKNKPKYVVCGHIHEGVGSAKIGPSKVYNLGVGQYQVLEF